jgi:cytoskeletal protein CcmA (bactofilin family)
MGKIDTLIGRTVHVRGDLEFSGALHLDGSVCGDVRAPSLDSTLSVSRYGCIDGAIDVANVILDGTVTGPIRARGRVVLGPTAQVRGDVYCGVIELALGAEIKGRLVCGTERDPGAAGRAA